MCFQLFSIKKSKNFSKNEKTALFHYVKQGYDKGDAVLQHGAGVVFYNARQNKIKSFKLYPSNLSLIKTLFLNQEYSGVHFHARLSSAGSVSLANVQPFISSRKIIFSHNGTLFLDTKNGVSDTKTLFHQYVKTFLNMKRLTETIEEDPGNGVFFVNKAFKKIFFIKKDYDRLWVRADRNLFIASSFKFLKKQKPVSGDGLYVLDYKTFTLKQVLKFENVISYYETYIKNNNKYKCKPDPERCRACPNRYYDQIMSLYFCFYNEDYIYDPTV